MTIAELLLQDFDLEIFGTRRTPERIPEAEAATGWKPHDKSMPMGRLAMHVAYLPKFGTYILTTPGMDMATTKLPVPDLTFHDRAGLLSALDDSAAELRTVLAGTSDDHLAEKWRFSFGEHVISDSPRSLTMYFNHLIHHRAQLGYDLRLNGVVIGSKIIAQPFRGDAYFHPRPSSAGANGYDATSSGGSNYGPTNQKFLDRVSGDVMKAHAENPSRPVPIDMVTASGSGLDPDITPANADFQASRVASARHQSLAQVLAVVRSHTQRRQLGLFGEPRTNVLELNLALDQADPANR